MGVGMLNRLTRAHVEAAIERFQKNPTLASEYLAAIVNDGDEKEFLAIHRH